MFGIGMLTQMQGDGSLTEEMRGEIDLTLVQEKNAGYFNEYVASNGPDITEGTAGRDTEPSASDDGGDDTGDDNSDQ